METTSKEETITPIILKAGIPLILSLAGLVILVRKSLSKASLLENHGKTTQTTSLERLKGEESFNSLTSTNKPSALENEEESIDTDSQLLVGRSISSYEPIIQEQINGLIKQIADLEMKEVELQLKFNQYIDLKEQESVLIGLKNILSHETARAEFLDREVSSLEAENKRLENFFVQYLKILSQLKYCKTENELLQRKLKKVVRKSMAQSRLIKERNLKVGDREAELEKNHKMIETRDHIIKKLEGEVRELEILLDRLKSETEDQQKKLDLADHPCSSKNEAEEEGISKEDYVNIVNELEELRKERAGEMEELIYLRWINACLRHELRRRSNEQKQQKQEGNHSEFRFDGSREINDQNCDTGHGQGSLLERNMSCSSAVHIDHPVSRSRKLLKRVRRWVESGDKEMGKQDDKTNCFGRHSVRVEAEDQPVQHKMLLQCLSHDMSFRR